MTEVFVTEDFGGSKGGRGDRFYAEAVPRAERSYEEYVRRREREKGER